MEIYTRTKYRTKYLKGNRKLVTSYSGTIVVSEAYYLGSQLHREDGPVLINYYKGGTISREFYCLKGRLHRYDGPAEIWYCLNGPILSKAYFLNDQRTTEDKLEKLSLKKKLQII